MSSVPSTGPKTIDNLPMQVNENYAQRQADVDKLIKSGLWTANLSLEAASAHGARTQVGIPLLPQIAILMGTFIKTSIAFFAHDAQVDAMRSANTYQTPSLGPIEKREKDKLKVADLMAKAPTEEQARATQILAVLAQTIEDDRLVSLVRGKMAELVPA